MIDFLDEADEIIKDQDSHSKKDIKEKSEMLDESDERNDRLETHLYLANKPLPPLPKKQNAFQKLWKPNFSFL